MDLKCHYCLDYIELDSSQCFLCRQYFCYSCLLLRPDIETHAKHAKQLIDSSGNCTITVGELKRIRLEEVVLNRVHTEKAPCPRCGYTYRIADIRGHQCQVGVKKSCTGCKQYIPIDQYEQHEMECKKEIKDQGLRYIAFKPDQEKYLPIDDTDVSQGMETLRVLQIKYKQLQHELSNEIDQIEKLQNLKSPLKSAQGSHSERCKNCKQVSQSNIQCQICNDYYCQTKCGGILCEGVCGRVICANEISNFGGDDNIKCIECSL